MQFFSRRYYLWSTWLFLISILLLSLLFTSCKDALPSTNHVTPTPQPAETPPLVNLITPHVLTIGIYANYFPQEYRDEGGQQIIGFDIDVIRSIADHLHLKTKFVVEDYSMLINDLATGRFDVVISAVSITPELQKKANFIPYFRGGESLLVSRGNPHQISVLSNLCGRKVAIKEGTFEQRELKDLSSNCLKEGKTAISVVVCPEYKASLKQLLEGKVAAVYQDSPVTDYFIKQNPDRFEIGGGIIGANLEGIAVRKNDVLLLSALQKALAQIKADGGYRNIITKWGLKSGDITANDKKADHMRSALVMTIVFV